MLTTGPLSKLRDGLEITMVASPLSPPASHPCRLCLLSQPRPSPSQKETWEKLCLFIFPDVLQNHLGIFPKNFHRDFDWHLNIYINLKRNIITTLSLITNMTCLCIFWSFITLSFCTVSAQFIVKLILKYFPFIVAMVFGGLPLSFCCLAVGIEESNLFVNYFISVHFN